MKRHYYIIILILAISSFGAKQSFTFLAPMEEAMNPVIRIEGTDETEINCEIPQSTDGQYTFEVDYTATRSTESYEMFNIPYEPILDFDNISELGTEVNFNGPDVFSSAINFFPFSFFDNTTNSLAIGENGLISLDPRQSEQINLRYPSANIPNSTLTRSSIFASHYDLMIFDVPSASVYYKIIGSEPARKMVITYVNADVFYCTDDRTTSLQVVLEELTNEIQIYIKNKSSACGAISNAVVGIQNEQGDLGYSPAGRNYDDGDWEAQNEAYEFKPNGERTPTISWIEGEYVAYSESNNIIGTTDQITVNADLTDLQYTVEIRYPNYRNELGEIIYLLLTDDIQVSPFYPIALDDEVVVCTETVNLNNYNEYVSLNPHENFTITYYSDANLTNPISNPTNYDIIGDNQTIYAQVAYSNDCYDISELQISSVYGLIHLEPEDLQIYLCDNVDSENPEGIEENYPVNNLDNLILNNINNGTVSYYSSPNLSSEISSINIVDGTQVWVDILVQGENSCRTPRIGPVTINFHETPQFLNLPEEIELVVCDKNWNYTEPIDDNQTWSDIFIANGLLTNDADNIITVFESEDEAISNTNALTEITMDTTDPTYNPDNNSRRATLYIRIEDENGCYSIKEVRVQIRFYGVDAVSTPSFNICSSGDTQIPIDLSCFLTEADFNNDGSFSEGMFNQLFLEDGTNSSEIEDLYNITYHATTADANAGINPINPNQTISSSDAPFKNFFVRFTLCSNCATDESPCFTVKSIRFRIITTQPNTDTVDVCYTNEANTFVENLSIFNYQLVNEVLQYNISYYTNQNDALNQENEINSYTFSGDNYLWVHIQSNYQFNGTSCFDNPNNPCTGVYRIRFVYGTQVDPIDFPPQQIDGVCDNNGDGSEYFDVTVFEDDIYIGNATFNYYQFLNEETLVLTGAIADPTNVMFTSTNGSATQNIYIKLTYQDTNCAEIIRLNITLNFLPIIETQPSFLCACLPTPGEYARYDLTAAIDNLFLPTNENNNNPLDNMVVTFHNNYNNALDGTNQIFNVANYQSTRGIEEIYVRFYSTESDCYTVETLTLKNLVQPIPIPGTIELCDLNINGYYDIFFNELNDIVMPNNSDSYYFSYFWTYDEALNNTNPIIEPTDESDPLSYYYEFTNLPDFVFVRVDADNGDCSGNSDQAITLCTGINQVALTTGILVDANMTEFELPPVCDTFEETGEINNPTYNDGIASGIDLMTLENEISQSLGLPLNEIRLLYYASLSDLQSDIFPFGETVIDNPNSYTNMDNSGNPLEQVYVKVENLTGAYCPIYVILNINILKGPEIFPEEEYYICPDSTVDIHLLIPEDEDVNNYNFEWTLPDESTLSNTHELIGMDQIGLYNVKITDVRTSCSSPIMNFVVRELEPPVITELIVHNESEIEVIAYGEEGFPIEYSLNNVDYQPSNHFYNLPPGAYDIWVRYNYNNKSCVGDVMSTIIIKLNNIITPNGDGLNDCISITDLNVFGEENTLLLVYDRYGKVVHEEQDNVQLKWCGKYNGRTLPSTSYWYKLIIPDGREKNGFFTLKNY